MVTKEETCFVDAVVRDPASIPACRVVVGWPGAGSSQEVVRIYQSLELDEYLEFPEKDVLHSERMRRDTALSPSVYWVRREASPVHARVAGSVDATFLSGQISSSLLGRATPSGFGSLSWISWTWTIATTLACLTAKVSCICPTGGNCPSASGSSATSCCLCPAA